MSTVSVTLPSDGSTAEVTDYNVPITTIVTDYNGNIDNDNISATAGISGTKLADTSVTSNKLNLSPQTAYVATVESRNNASFGALATAGPAVTVTIGSNGLALVSIVSGIVTTSSYAGAGFDISGANTTAASDGFAIFGPVGDGKYGASFLVTGLNAGSTTFTMTYKTGAANSFNNRRITVVPL